MSDAPRIVRVALPVPLSRYFDYLLPDGMTAPEVGARVRVPFGARKLVGIVLALATDSELPRARLKAITEVLDEEALLPPEVMALLTWAADYYLHPIGEVMQAALPVLLRQGQMATVTAIDTWHATDAGRSLEDDTLKRAPVQARVLAELARHETGCSREQLAPLSTGWRAAVKALTERGLVECRQQGLGPEVGSGDAVAPMLNEEQQAAVAAIAQGLGEYRCTLLDGITGSGKTEVYLRVMQQVLDAGQQVLMLVPEIGLTPQLVERVRGRLAVPVVVLHSGLTDRERCNGWLHAHSGEAAVVLGTRSAVFTPMPRLGLVVVDEEHDPSYKQQEGFRYHARDLAVLRASRASVPVVLGSATPSLESLRNVGQGHYQQVDLRQRAGEANPPRVGLIDLRAQKPHDGLSHPLVQAIGERLKAGEQSLVFLNRRGYAPVLMCHDCGAPVACPRCDAHLTLHRSSGRLRCHHCGSDVPVPETCPACGHERLLPVGEGTERVEQALARLFPAAHIERIDRDTTAKKGELDRKFAAIRSGEVDIVVGTQMLAKGHDFPAITLVGVLNADQGLYGADFRGPEYLLQQVMQVGGRAGRADRPGEVLVQTLHPEHEVFIALQAHDYGRFAQAELEQRRAAGLPPWAPLALLRAEATQAGAALGFLHAVRTLAERAGVPAGVELMEPLPAPMERRAGRYRAQLLVQAGARKPLHRFLAGWLPLIEAHEQARRVRWSLDVDPMDMY